jgi:hypothetical protein
VIVARHAATADTELAFVLVAVIGKYRVNC